MTRSLWGTATASERADSDLIVLAEREPGSLLRAVCLAWHRGADLAFVDEPAPTTLFAQRRVHEREVSQAEFRRELPAELLDFWRKCRRSISLERRLFFALRHGGGNTAEVAKQALGDIRQYGFRYVLNKASDAGRALGSRARQVMVELHRLKGLGRAETPHHIADLLVLHFRERFGQYGIVLLVGERAFVSGDEGEVLIDDAGPYAEALAKDDFEHFWHTYYGSQSIERRANPRLRQQRLPKKYWSWVREAVHFTRAGSCAARQGAEDPCPSSASGGTGPCPTVRP